MRARAAHGVVRPIPHLAPAPVTSTALRHAPTLPANGIDPRRMKSSTASVRWDAKLVPYSYREPARIQSRSTAACAMEFPPGAEQE